MGGGVHGGETATEAAIPILLECNLVIAVNIQLHSL